MITTITIISLSVILAVAVLLLGRVAHVSHRRSAIIRNLEARLSRYRTANEDRSPIYLVRRGIANDSRDWAVYRISIQDGCLYGSIIKVFTDEDEDFNKAEAEELCEKLKEK